MEPLCWNLRSDISDPGETTDLLDSVEESSWNHRYFMPYWTTGLPDAIETAVPPYPVKTSGLLDSVETKGIPDPI